MIYGQSESWIDRSPRNMKISSTILGGRIATPLVDSPKAIKEEEDLRAAQLEHNLKNSDLDPFLYSFANSQREATMKNSAVKIRERS